MHFTAKEVKSKMETAQPSLCWIRKEHQGREHRPVCGGATVGREEPGSLTLHSMLTGTQTHSGDFWRERSQMIFTHYSPSMLDLLSTYCVPDGAKQFINFSRG